MSFDSALLYSFLIVFCRCSAMLLVSPIFGAQNTPVQVRVFTTMAIAAALTCVVMPSVGSVPSDLYTFGAAVLKECLAGMLIGGFMSLVLQAAQIAGALIDLEMGLSMSQTMNPLTGVPVTVVAQFKFLLAIVVFLTLNCHHQMIIALMHSYQSMPELGMGALPAIRTSLVGLIEDVCLLALQMAAPVIAVSMIVDAGLGIVNKAVPQMPAMLVGLPAKVIIGMIALSVGLPAMSGAVSSGVSVAMHDLVRATGMR